MNLFKIFIKNDVPAVGLGYFRDEKPNYSSDFMKENVRQSFLKPDYSKNFFLL